MRSVERLRVKVSNEADAESCGPAVRISSAFEFSEEKSSKCKIVTVSLEI